MTVMATELVGTKKLVVGWFSFTCCEDSTILLTELLNDHLDQWKKVVEFRYFKALKTKNEIRELDVAFIEGAISSPKQAKEVLTIRENAKYVVAVGACAVTGLPSASRNNLVDEKTNYKLYWYFSHFDYSDKVQKLSEVIKIDDQINGCPMNAEVFMSTLNRYLKEFGIVH
ncbi:MAG: NADH ubiquinone oxidoreductase 20 kDa subunit [Microgenomates group bacterium GW2011_GWA2_44_7]|nr:MAG: NADH ubiquinone oxidoreductase 20 kDa subunit [Microgenomates group bacterium GW2011_GWA2_44_7]KKT77827.1 MAG: NADH ubiquinone oxidoreductase 20 kDa subunit [Microgenomates group bacterium GW2011_GWB1_44_8]